MKKLMLLAVICCLSLPVLAQNTTYTLSEYVHGDLIDADVATIGNEPMPQPNISVDEIAEYVAQTIKQKLTLSKQTPQQDENPNTDEKNFNIESDSTAEDVLEFIADEKQYDITGELGEWEQKRADTYKYVQESDWLTGLMISQGDWRLVRKIFDQLVGITDEVLHIMGMDTIKDEIDKAVLDMQEGNAKELLQNASEVTTNIIEASASQESAIDTHYVKVQHNAFRLLVMNSGDFRKLIAKYPETTFLLDDLYTFFKWRHDLREIDKSYSLNENEFASTFWSATRTNSFFGWWELAIWAKKETRNAAAQNLSVPNTRDQDKENHSMRILKHRARNARYFGRKWNGLQRYAVNHKMLPKELYPKRGAGLGSIKRSINRDLQGKTQEEVLFQLDTIRNTYVETRQETEQAWQEWLNARQQQKEQLMKEKLLELLPKPEDPQQEEPAAL